MSGARSGLTERQRTILALVASRIEERGIAPSVQEVADALGLQFAAAYLNLTSLERKGYLRRIPDVPRGLVVLRRG